MAFPHGRADRAQPRRARAGEPGRTPVEREADCRHPDIDGRAANPRSGHGLVNDYRRSEAERDLRPSKTQQKISGRLRSEKTTRDRYAIRGYGSTAAKHGCQIFTAIRDALAGNPWIPPIPATA